MSSLNDWIAALFEHPNLLRMGHAQRADDQNLGLGWLYYALARIVRPTSIVVIGSYRGYAPLVFARALADNSEGGKLHFIDPSLVDDQWKVPADVQTYFGEFDVTNIMHHCMTTQEFLATPAYRELEPPGIVFVDGYHTAEHARFDFNAFADKLAPQGLILLHDSIWRQASPMYGPGREYVRDVVDFVSEIKTDPAWQVFDLPFGEGLSLVRRAVAPPECLDRSLPPVRAVGASAP
jgi:predicted O-methyltransferase YrrM